MLMLLAGDINRTRVSSRKEGGMGYTIFGKVDTLEEFEKLKSKKEPEFTIKVEPFSWNDNFSEVALEDFSMVQKKLPYGICQSIGMALAKLELLEKQGCKVEEMEDAI